MKALHVRAARKTLGNLLPVLTVELLDGLGELLVLLGGPVALIRTVLVLRWPSLVDIGVLSLSATDLSLGSPAILLTQRWCGHKEVHSLVHRVRCLVLHHLHHSVGHI